jgi:flagellar hook assembly protein FlgD
VVNQKDQPVAGQHSEIWDGRNRRGQVVANGVYFYRLELEGEGTFWGKVMVLD